MNPPDKLSKQSRERMHLLHKLFLGLVILVLLIYNTGFPSWFVESLIYAGVLGGAAYLFVILNTHQDPVLDAVRYLQRWYKSTYGKSLRISELAFFPWGPLVVMEYPPENRTWAYHIDRGMLIAHDFTTAIKMIKQFEGSKIISAEMMADILKNSGSSMKTTEEGRQIEITNEAP